MAVRQIRVIGDEIFISPLNIVIKSGQTGKQHSFKHCSAIFLMCISIS